MKNVGNEYIILVGKP